MYRGPRFHFVVWQFRHSGAANRGQAFSFDVPASCSGLGAARPRKA